MFFAVAAVKPERKSGLLTLWCDRELLGVSAYEWAASTLQLLKDTTGTDGHQKKKAYTGTGTQMHNPLKPVHRSVPGCVVACENKSQTKRALLNQFKLSRQC